MRILQVQSRSRTRGGADDVMDLDAQLLRSAGHDVKQFLYEPVGDSPGAKAALDVVWNRAASQRLGAHLRQMRPDIVHVHSPYPLLSPVVFRVANRAGAATVTTLHNYRLACIVGTCLRNGKACEDCVGRVVKTPAIRHRCYHQSRAASSAMAVSLTLHRTIGTFRHDVHRYLALTDFGRDLLVRDGYPGARIGIAPNCVADPGEKPPRTGPFAYAAFVGRFVPEKGIHTLLEAWRTLNVPLRIAGDGPARAAVERATRDNPRIQYVGWLGEEEEAALVSGADILVFASLWYEGQPLVMLRAMAHGVAVLSSNIANIAETAVAQGAGVSFGAGDPAALAAAVTRLAHSPNRTRALGAAGRQAYLRKHTPQRVVDGLVEHYIQAIRTRERECNT